MLTTQDLRHSYARPISRRTLEAKDRIALTNIVDWLEFRVSLYKWGVSQLSTSHKIRLRFLTSFYSLACGEVRVTKSEPAPFHVF